MYYPFVDYKDKNDEIKNILQNNDISLESLEEDIRDIIENGDLCINNIDENIELRKCLEVEYISNNDYKCSKCINGYQLDNSNNHCIQINEIEVKELSKKECNSNTIVIKAENDTFCEEPIGKLEGCSNGTKAITKYVNTIYNCYNCSLNYMPSFNYFENRWKCGRAGERPFEIAQELPSDAYKGIDRDNSTINGTCSIQEAFSPNGIDCYRCNNDKVGMPGCKGSCSYALDRVHIIECEGECLSGYIETSKGVCELCEEINKGCLNCIYNKSYPAGFSGIKRENRRKRSIKL